MSNTTKYMDARDPKAPRWAGAPIRCLVEAIRLLHTHTHDIPCVFRGLSLTQNQIDRFYAVGEVFQWQSFVSTSMKLSVARDQFSGRNLEDGKRPVIFEIRRNPHHPTAAKIWEYAYEPYKSEKEVLMIPGVRFKVLSKYVRGDITNIVVREICLLKHE